MTRRLVVFRGSVGWLVTFLLSLDLTRKVSALMGARSMIKSDAGRRTFIFPVKHSRATVSQTLPGLFLVNDNVKVDGLRGTMRREKMFFPTPTASATAECGARAAAATAANLARRSNRTKAGTRGGERCCTSSRSEGTVLKRLRRSSTVSMLKRIMAVALFWSVHVRLVDGGQCVFTQECFQAGVDTECTPASTEEGTRSFPLDSAHGFGVAHDKVWDGSMEDLSTGLCDKGTPDHQGRCIVDFVAPKGLDPVAPVICPQYKEDGCCSWQQNYALYQNLRTLVDSFGSSTGCLACAVNLVNFWCALVCSPDQASFLTLHDPPYAQRKDDLTGGSGMVLQADVLVDSNLACSIYDSCKSVAIVGETTAMQSGLGLLKFQMQTGAIGHGEYFFLSFDTVGSAGTDTTSHGHRHGQPRQIDNGGYLYPLTLDTLSCDSFYYPGSTTVPFPYPPPKENLASCSCDYCAAACATPGGGGVDVDVTNQRPIPVLDGFRFGLVGGVFCAVMLSSMALFWWRQNSSKGTAGRMSFSTCVRSSH